MLCTSDWAVLVPHCCWYLVGLLSGIVQFSLHRSLLSQTESPVPKVRHLCDSRQAGVTAEI